MKVFLTGGGSGGHIYPNIALIEELKLIQKKQPLGIGYIGQKASMEEELILPTNIQFFPISAGKLRRYWDVQNFLDPFKILLGFLQSIAIFLREKPSVLFSKGGFVSVPVVIAAWLCRIPVCIHESDTTPGLASKITSYFARRICVAWNSTLHFFPEEKVVHTGIPIRQSISQGNPSKGQALCQFSYPERKTLLVVGGSLGAGALNDFIEKNILTIIEKMNVIHITGKGKEIMVHSDTNGSYVQFEFPGDDIIHLFAMADLILSRAGSTLLWEFAEIEKPAILIPLPGHASRGDQVDNAKEYQTLFPHLAYTIPQESLTLDSFQHGIDILEKQQRRPSSQIIQARKTIIEILLTLGQHA